MTVSNFLKEKKIAIVAGGGKLPQLIIDALEMQQIPHIILSLPGNVDDKILQNNKYIQIFPGLVKPVLAILKKEHVTAVVFAGHIKRPSFFSLKVDSIGAKLLARIMACKIHGDNTVLSIIAEFLEEQGFKVISPNSIIPSLLAPVGNLGTAQPDENDVIDISIGQTILGLLGHMDIGQAVIVENGYVLGIEAAEGTDSLISRSASLKREQVRKGVLVKMKKNNQDKRLDLPVIGLTTIENVYRANLRGIAISAQRSIIINFEEVIRLVNKYNIFIIGID